ncbi:hypothetical protein [Petroclostridium sp. X23]|uniref:hypothetical protein n=1 Tax=Petroclostridium sp. X23 TaxID=3045146 RepID=UPI0024AD6178|nr:hypothetical protein [Petroclostridium sp. X23]WHH60667.1 hypothetical protein QKW49_08195 [Petroclostridium sp. X23]
MDNFKIEKCKSNLPVTLEDLSKFILVGREKLASVRAEIRAIEKLKLAQAVRDQKKEEGRMLAEALLDAEVRIGELLKNIPTAQGTRSDLTSVHRWTEVGNASNHTCENLSLPQKTKSQIVKEFNFTTNQQKRFEILADNKDLVEQVKSEARENNKLPTRSRVLYLAQERKKNEQERSLNAAASHDYQTFCAATAKKFSNILSEIRKLEVDDKHLKAWADYLNGPLNFKNEQRKANEAVAKIMKINNFLKGLSI